MVTVPISDGTGNIERYPAFKSQYVADRTIDVWCPPGYALNTGARYPVVYMHDGQNLFDPALAYGGVDWAIDEAIVRLQNERSLPGAIVVGLWNSGEGRWRDYMPQKPVEMSGGAAILPKFLQVADGPPISDQYLRFIVEEVKPFVDATYRTLPDQQHTFVMGSSMGGLISLYALEQYPGVFGGAGCLSTHWPAGEEPLVAYLGRHLPTPGAHKLYFDYGTATLDALYEPFQLQMDEHMRAAGYTQGKDWITLKFDGAEHNEAAWRKRVDIPLLFLLS